MPIRRAHEPSSPALRPATPASPTAPSAPSQPTAPSSRLTNDFTPTVSSAVQSKLNTVRALMAGHTDRAEEKQVLTLFRSASKAELNGLISGLSRDELHELVEDMDDRFLGPDNRTAFLTLLSTERVADLPIDARAKVIQALQHGETDSVREKAITQLFLATKGEGLSALKNAIDGGGDYHDLQQLVFHDLDSKELRGQLLAHFAREATPKDAKVKVLSDIDDTFYVNLKDDRFPKKTVYPGVRALYAELDKGPDAQKPDRAGDLMFLSARPYDPAGVTEGMTRSMLADHGVTQATVLSGDFLHLIGNESIAAKKFDNWEQVRQLYPEYGSVFLGDSGQGDAIFGANATATTGGDLRSAFIHNVTHLDAAGKAEWARKGVFVFDTYVGAASEAFKRGLISKDGLSRVVSDAQRDFAQVVFDSPTQKAQRQAELDRDVAAARALL